MSVVRRPFGPLVCILLLGATSSARAALGEAATSVPADREALRATRNPATAGPGYSIEELQVGSTKIREFVSPAGVVFAVTWSGITHPDLAQLLGRYAREYESARPSARTQGNRGHQRRETAHAVVETWGHQRRLQGRAYVPALMPPGVTVDDLG